MEKSEIDDSLCAIHDDNEGNSRGSIKFPRHSVVGNSVLNELFSLISEVLCDSGFIVSSDEEV